MQNPSSIELHSQDALLIVDMQNDFLPGGSLAVPNGDKVVPVLNRYITEFVHNDLPVFATRDWHPANHCSFRAQGGIWPLHCVAGTKGAEFATLLALPENTIIVSKAKQCESDAYSGFEGTNLEKLLRQRDINRLFIGGLATDYCVVNTVKDAIKNHFKVILLKDAIKAVEVNAGDGDKAIGEMLQLGAISISFDALVENAES